MSASPLPNLGITSPSLIMPNPSPQRIPLPRIRINIRHATPQARLQLGRIVAEQMHHGRPREAGEDGPGVVADDGAAAGLRHDGQEARAGLDGQSRRREHGAREDVDDDLLADRRDAARLGALPEDEVAAEEAREEAVVGAWWVGEGC